MLGVATVLLLVSAIFIWICFKVKIRKAFKAIDNIPGPKPLLFLGNVLQLGTNPKGILEKLTNISKSYPSTCSIWLGNHCCVIIQEVKHIEAVLTSNKTLDKPYMYKLWEPWFGTGIISSSGDKWKVHRKILTPAFQFKFLETFLEVFNSNADILMKQLSSKVDELQLDIFPYISLFALDCICETSMGVKINAQLRHNSDYVEAIDRLCNAITIRSFSPWLHPDFIFNLSPTGKIHNKNLAIVHEMTARVINERKKSVKERVTVADQDNIGMKKAIPFLDLLLQNENEEKLTLEEVHEEVNTIMFGGHDTTASAISFVCWCLANHQDVQEKAMLEQKDIFGDSDRYSTFSDLQNMKYLDQVIKESLRIYPAGPLLGRKVTEDLDIGDYNIPNGSTLIIIPFLIHRNEEYFADPEKFDPDRFSAENILKRNPYCYIPFSAGPRNCIGIKYANIVLKAAISKLLRKYKLLPGTTPLELCIKGTLKSASGINIRLQRR